jgi:hypothetical protein
LDNSGSLNKAEVNIVQVDFDGSNESLRQMSFSDEDSPYEENIKNDLSSFLDVFSVASDAMVNDGANLSQ